MADENKDILYWILAAITAIGAAWKYLRFGKQKDHAETSEMQAKTESLLLDNRIKLDDHYKKRYEDISDKLDEVLKQLEITTKLYKSAISDLESVKRDLTSERLRATTQNE